MSDRFYIGETAHGSSYIIDRTSQRSAIGRSGSFVVVIDSGEASWVCAALNEKQDRDNVAEVEPTGERETVEGRTTANPEIVVSLDPPTPGEGEDDILAQLPTSHK